MKQIPITLTLNLTGQLTLDSKSLGQFHYAEHPPASNPNRTPNLPATQNQTEVGEVVFISEKELLARLPISRRTLFAWRMAGKVPWVRLSGRRILFHWPSVEIALLRRQRGGEW